MDKPIEHIPAGEFKTKCLGILEEVHDTKQTVIVTKRGVPFAMIVPYKSTEESKSKLFGALKNSIAIIGDIISPEKEKWEVDE